MDSVIALVTKMAEFSRKRFLEYYDFQDEPNMVPNYFFKKRYNYTNLIEQVAEDVRVGVKLKDAIRLNAGVTRDLVNKWYREFNKELDEGKTDTPLCRLFLTGIKADADLYRKVMRMTMQKAEEGDGETIRFLAKNRLGYGKPQGTNVNVDNSENNNIQITISDMKAIEPIDVKGEEVEGTKELEE